MGCVRNANKPQTKPPAVARGEYSASQFAPPLCHVAFNSAGQLAPKKIFGRVLTPSTEFAIFKVLTPTEVIQMSATRTLLDILSGDMSYDSYWGIYAEKIDGKFEPESPARFGQRQFENGGMLDNCEYFSNNESACDDRQSYTDGDDDFNQEWAYEYIEEMNSVLA